jgi:type II secretory pathway pseudopilin PulG
MNVTEETHRVTVRPAHGFALIDLVFVCGIIGILSSIALPRLSVARQAAGAASAIGSMRAINSAELTFAFSCGSGFYAPSLTTLGTPPIGTTEPFISKNLSVADTVTKSGYTFQLSGTPYPGAPPSCNGLALSASAQGFKAGGDPAVPGNIRFFATNSTNTIVEDIASLYATMPENGVAVAGHPLR